MAAQTLKTLDKRRPGTKQEMSIRHLLCAPPAAPPEALSRDDRARRGIAGAALPRARRDQRRDAHDCTEIRASPTHVRAARPTVNTLGRLRCSGAQAERILAGRDAGSLDACETSGNALARSAASASRRTIAPPSARCSY